MMKFVPSLDIYVTKIEDLRDKINDDVYECVESLVNEEESEISSNYDNLKEEFEVYESELDAFRSDMNDTRNELEQIEKTLDELFDYINDTKRINRETLKDMLKKVDIEHAIETLTSNL